MDQKSYKRLFGTNGRIDKKTELQEHLVRLYLEIWEYFSASFVPQLALEYLISSGEWLQVHLHCIYC